MDNIYQLKITLEGSEPVIWRSVQVAEETNFLELNAIIQVLMDWEEYYRFEFVVNGKTLPQKQEGVDIEYDHGGLATTLFEQIDKVGEKFTYTYYTDDKVDNWRMTVEVEQMVPEEPETYYPVCVAGENASPPDDTSGIEDYKRMLDARSDPEHDDHESARNWLGEDWDATNFDRDKVNLELQKIDEDIDFEDDEGFGYDEVEQLKEPGDVLNHPVHFPGIYNWLDEAVQEEASPEQKTLRRLQENGMDEEEARKAIAGAMAVEWYYSVKYGMRQVDERYEMNLERLPEQPVEIPDLGCAVKVIEQAVNGIPYEAIEYLRNQPTEKVLDIIIEGMVNAYDLKRFYNHAEERWMNAPLWYAIAAEAHTHPRLIEPVFNLYLANDYDWDLLQEQGMFLLSQLGEKYPDMVVPKVIAAVAPDSAHASGSVHYLYDAIQYADKEKYGAQLLAILENPETPVRDQWAHAVAHLQVKEAMPMIEAILKERKAEKKRKGSSPNWFEFHDIVEYEEALEELQSGISKYPKQDGPCHLNRSGWREFYGHREDIFYNQAELEEAEDWSDDELPLDDDFDSDSFDNGFRSPTPFIKEKKPGRNDPCYCGSGKKYKKCCLKKDEALERI